MQPLLPCKSSITYCECMFVALRIQYAMRMRHIVTYGLAGSKKFFHNFRKKLLDVKCVF
jgi:hypothetical protein